MRTTADHFERALKRQLREHRDPVAEHHRMAPARPIRLVVRLAVRKKRLGMDHVFTFEAKTVSRLEARILAERAARDAGWPIVGHVIDYEKNP